EDLVKKIVRVVTDLMESFRLGNVMKNGIATVIAGRPNAGKSTLLNALLNEDRAIVSEVAGTTRDTIEEILNIKGLQFRLIDTAGIRDALDSIEKIGVEKTMEKISKASLVIYLFDVITTSPEQLWEDVERFLHGNAVLNSGCKIVFVANKMDLNPYTQPGTYYRNGLIGRDNLITASALHQMNIEALKDVLYNTIVEDPKLLDTTLVTNSRHYEALFKTRQSLESVLEGLSGGISGDILSLDIRQALYHLGTITGQVSNEDLLDSIFSRFCIGK
ncbi:MAG TPA: GTP-binding protein, partial [Saprospiraceae bacterium]|nr:GTP-binding protein [Saprospiraceae bacterium]